MRIGFSGYYGMANYGDDLFAITAFLASQKYWEKFDPLLLCRRISNFKANYGIAPFIPHGALANLELTGKFCRLTNLLWNSFNLDKIVFAGGSLFHSGGISARDFVFLLKRGRRDYFSAIGVSIGPFEDMSSERRVCKKLRSFEYISVRDRVSYERLMSYDIEGKVVQAADLVGVLPEFLQRKKDGEGRFSSRGMGIKSDSRRASCLICRMKRCFIAIVLYLLHHAFQWVVLILKSFVLISMVWWGMLDCVSMLRMNCQKKGFSVTLFTTKTRGLWVLGS